MALPLDSHPIYCLRKLTLIIAFIGIILCCVTIPFWEGFIVIPTTIFLVLSVLFCGADLILYAIKKVKDPDSDPEWPTRKWMTGDVILAFFLQYVFWGTLARSSSFYFLGALGAYGALTGLLCSLLHARAFWKQLLARSEKKWLANLPNQPCARCGYLESVHEPFPRTQHSNLQPPNTSTYAGPSADFCSADVHTPGSDSAMEEGLLIGSEVGAGYGSIGDPEPTIDQPEEVIVRKGKGRKASRDVLSKSAWRRAEL